MKIAARDLSDWFNPVFIKELRQFFHNYLILAVMALLLIGQQLILLFVHLAYTSSGNLNDNTGRVVFTFIVVGLVCCIFVVCGVGAAQRFLLERQNEELDFCKLTAISPTRIIWGKLCSSLVLLVFITSLCLPFIGIAYFLRGIAILQMLKVMLLLLPVTLAIIFSAILVGAIGKKGLAGLLSIGGSIYGITVLTLIFNDTQVWTSSSGADLPLLLFAIIIPLFWSGLCYVLSVASVSHSLANRMLPVRIYLLTLLAACPLAMAALAALTDEHVLDFLQISFSLTASIVVGIVAALAACERSRPSLHIQNQCPRNIFLRSGFFLLSSGSGGGITLAALILLLLVALPVRLASGSSDLYLIYTFTDIAIYLLFYAALAIFLQEWMPRLSGLAWFCLNLIVLLLLPGIVSGFIGVTEAKTFNYLTITSPFFLFAVDYPEHFGQFKHSTSLPFATAGLFLASRSISLQWRALRLNTADAAK